MHGRLPSEARARHYRGELLPPGVIYFNFSLPQIPPARVALEEEEEEGDVDDVEEEEMWEARGRVL